MNAVSNVFLSLSRSGHPPARRGVNDALLAELKCFTTNPHAMPRSILQLMIQQNKTAAVN